MSVVTITGTTRTAVTPAGTRRRPRNQQLRGPVARPLQVPAPVRRPVQPLAPALAAPVQLRQRRVAAQSSTAGLQLTQRGLAVVLGLFLTLFVASVVVIVTQFLAVSNAPIETGVGGDVAVMAQVAPGR